MKLPLYFLILSISFNNLIADKPNVLLISIDDLRPQTNSYGHSQMVTPNLDQLSEEGYQFNRAYVQVAICGASRTSMFTGLRPDTTKVYNNNTDFRDEVPWVTTLPKHFSNNGYYSVGIGKNYHNNNNDDGTNSGFPNRTDSSDKTWDLWLGDSGSNWGQPYVDPDNLAIHQARKQIQQQTGQTTNGPVTECVETPYNSYLDGRVTDEAIAKINNLANQSQPFFLGVGIFNPHLPFIAPKKYWDYYTEEDLDLPQYRQRAQNTSSYRFSYTWSEELRTYYGVPAKPTSGNNHPNNTPSFENEPSVSHENLEKELIHGYYACVSYADDMVGKLVQALKDNGIYDNTIILVWGDHGWHLGEHNQWTKHTNYEIANRIPLIIKAPNMQGNTQVNELVEALDIYPTLSELAGLELPVHLEGDSLVSLMRGENDILEEPAISQYPRYSGRMGYSMRTDNYRYIQWNRNGVLEYEELYNHDLDPKENVNLAQNINNQTQEVIDFRNQFNLYLDSIIPKEISTYSEFLNINSLPEGDVTRDSDGDGISDIMEYAVNLSPQSNDIQMLNVENGSGGMKGLPNIQLYTDPSNVLVMRYLKRTSATDITYVPEFSSSLSMWQSVGLEISSDKINNQWELITVADGLDLGAEVKRFARLRINHNP